MEIYAPAMSNILSSYKAWHFGYVLCKDRTGCLSNVEHDMQELKSMDVNYYNSKQSLQIGSNTIKPTVHQFAFNINFSLVPCHESHENGTHVTSHLWLTQGSADHHSLWGRFTWEDHAPPRETAGKWHICITNAWGNYKNINGIRLLIFFLSEAHKLEKSLLKITSQSTNFN